MPAGEEVKNGINILELEKNVAAGTMKHACQKR